MDNTPHTHKVEVRSSFWSFFDLEGYRVTYGDTTKTIPVMPKRTFERRLNRAIEAVIKQHDRGSIESVNSPSAKAARLAEEANSRVLMVAPQLTYRRSDRAPARLTERRVWGSEALKEAEPAIEEGWRDAGDGYLERVKQNERELDALLSRNA